VPQTGVMPQFWENISGLVTGITAFLCMLVLWSTLSTLLVAVLFRTSPLTRMANLYRHSIAEADDKQRTGFEMASVNILR